MEDRRLDPKRLLREILCERATFICHGEGGQPVYDVPLPRIDDPTKSPLQVIRLLVSMDREKIVRVLRQPEFIGRIEMQKKRLLKVEDRMQRFSSEQAVAVSSR